MTSAAKAYTFRTVFFMLGYVVALVLAVGGALDAIGGVSGWVLAAAVAAPVAVVEVAVSAVAVEAEAVAVVVAVGAAAPAGTTDRTGPTR